MVVVTGGSGHLGANLVRALLERDRPVRCLVHETDGRGLDGLEVERVPGDLTEPATLARLCDGAETVFHCAGVISITGEQNGLLRRVNVEGVKAVADVARMAGVRRFVHVSSCHAYDLTVPRVHEAGPRPGPTHPAYDRSKAEGEAALRTVEGLDFVIVNPGGILGPWDLGPSRMGKAFLDLRDRKLPALMDGGFYFVDVRDVVEAMLAAETSGRPGQNYLLGGSYVRMRDLFSLAAGICGAAAPRIVAPLWLARCFAPLATRWAQWRGIEPLYTADAIFALDTPAANFDQEKARAELGFRPRPLAETVDAVYESFARLGQ